MEVFNLPALGIAISEILTWAGGVAFFSGLLIGVIAALVPGIGVVSVAAIALPFTALMSTPIAFIFLAALMGGGGFAGSITAILMNVPGDSVNAPTCLDGYPMARQGRASEALGASAAASVVGAVIGLVLLCASLPFVRFLVTLLGPPEFFALTVIGIALVGAVTGESMLKSLAAGFFGMLLGLIGENRIGGGVRLEFGTTYLSGGIPVVPVLVGFFAVAAIYEMIVSSQPISIDGKTSGSVWVGVRAVFQKWRLLVLSSVIGTVTGFIPGIGQVVTTWAAYFAAVRISREPETFGKGNIEGVIAPEATMYVKEMTSLMPTVALGIPAGLLMAILLSAFQMHGVPVGAPMLAQHMDIVWLIVVSMFVCSIATSVIGLALAEQLTKLTTVPVRWIAPIIYAYALLGTFADRGLFLDVTLAVAFGFLGILFLSGRYPSAPLLIGLVLSPIAESYFYQSYQLSRGSYSFLLDPLPLIMLCLALLVALAPAFGRLGEQKAKLSESLSENVEHSSWPAAEAFTTILLALVTFGVLAQIGSATGGGKVFPMVVGTPLAAILICLLFGSGRSWIRSAAGHRTISFPSESGVWTTAGNIWERDRESIRSWGWILLMPIMIVIFGMLAGPAVYLAIFLCFYNRTPSRKNAFAAVLTAVAIGVFNYYLLEQVLYVPPYRGLISGLFSQ